MNNDEFIMMRCISLAKKGAGYVSPNPLVGCVIVKDGKIAAEGYHKRFGESHAEINAINSTIRKGINLKGAVLYVNLEPCCHYGKTPPCVDKIIEHEFSKVVIGCRDPNPQVSGRSIRKLKQNNIEVSTGILENECRTLNKFFIKYMIEELPYVTLKAAQTMDGMIAREDYSSKWISSPESRKIVHSMRSEYDAVLVGSRTVKYDNPRLNVRLVNGRNPVRIVIDEDLGLKTNYRIFKDNKQNQTFVLTGRIKNEAKAKELKRNSIILVECRKKGNSLNLRQALLKLGKIGITSILIEGGAETFSHFLGQRLVDEILLFVSPKVFGRGIRAFKFNYDFSKYIRSVQKVGNDVMFQFQLKEY